MGRVRNSCERDDKGKEGGEQQERVGKNWGRLEEAGTRLGNVEKGWSGIGKDEGSWGR